MEAKASLRFGKLRIAWSVLWVFAALLVVVLWVRSYYMKDCVSFRGIASSDTTLVTSEFGAVSIAISIAKSRPFGWHFSTESPRHTMSFSGFYLGPRFDGDTAAVPHWFLSALCIVFAILPWTAYLRERYRRP